MTHSYHVGTIPGSVSEISGRNVLSFPTQHHLLQDVRMQIVQDLNRTLADTLERSGRPSTGKQTTDETATIRGLSAGGPDA